MTEKPRAWDLAGRLSERWTELMSGRNEAPSGDVAEAAAAAAPVIWLIGKVQSGKSSIVRGITGATDAEVGSGFRPCTRTARIFDFPEHTPAIRFLDTRGLGETGYDPTEDLGIAERSANLVLVVMRAMDHQQEAVLRVVADVRRRHPGWPLIVAQTCLHDAYAPGSGHILPYPFAAGMADAMDSRLPETLTRSLVHQRRVVQERIGGTGAIVFIPIDFTHDDDGFTPTHYGLEALIAAIRETAPESLAATLAEIAKATTDQVLARATPTILAHAGAAAAVDLVPVAGALAVPGVQARLLHTLAQAHGVDWDRRAIGEFGACLGAGVITNLVARFGIRQLVKLIPVYGQTVGAAAAAATSFATTYALGWAALEFVRRRRRGESDPAAVAAAYRQALDRAFRLARDRGLGAEGDRKPGDRPAEAS